MMRAWGVLKGSIAIVMMLAFLCSCAAPGQGGSAVSPGMEKPMGSVAGSQTLTVYSEKSYEGRRVGVLNPGDSVAIDRQSGDWSQVTFDNDKGQTVTGWIPSDFITMNTAQQSGGKDLSGMKTRTTLEGGLTGAAVGAAAGALVAAMLGVNPARGAALGAVIGAPVGLAAGVYVANQKAKYANEEEYLDACIHESRQYNEEARKDIRYMKSYIAREEFRIARLKREIARNESKKALAQAELRNMAVKKKAMDKMISSMEGEVGAQQNAIAGASTDPARMEALQREVATTRQSIERFKKERDQLVSVMMKTKDLTL